MTSKPRRRPCLAVLAGLFIISGCGAISQSPSAMDEMIRPSWQDVSYANARPAHPIEASPTTWPIPDTQPTGLAALVAARNASIVAQQRLQVRVYDIRDLLGQRPGVAATTTANTEMADDLIKAIKETLDQPSWAPNGQATIVHTGGYLVISQTHKNHQELADVLDQIRETRDMCIGEQVILLHLNSHGEALLREHLTKLDSRAATQQAPLPSSTQAHWILDDARRDAFLKTALSAKGVRYGKSWRATLFNGQEELIPDAYFPQTFLPPGSAAQPANVMWTFAQATVSADRRYLATNLHSQALNPTKEYPGVVLNTPSTFTCPDGATVVVEIGKGRGWALWAIVRMKILVPCECDESMRKIRNSFQPLLAGPAVLSNR